MENPDALTHSPPADAATLAEGLKDSLPIVISYIPVAFAFGLNATKLGFTPLESLFFSCIIYAGASQFVITAMLAAGSSLWVAALTVMAMDVRHVLYGPSLRSRIQRVGIRNSNCIAIAPTATIANKWSRPPIGWLMPAIKPLSP